MPLSHKLFKKNTNMAKRYPSRTSGNVDFNIEDDDYSGIRGSETIGMGTSRNEAEIYASRQGSLWDSMQNNNPYIDTPFEAQYNNILTHYMMLIQQAEANRKWYEDLGLSRYTEQLVTQYYNDMYAELRSLESTYTGYVNTLPSTIVALQNEAGLNSDLIGLQYQGYSGSSGSSSGGSSARSTGLPSSSPAHEALSMGLAMIGSLTDFATNQVPSLISSIGAIRGISLDNDIKKQQLHTTQFNNFALENEYLREFALNNFSPYVDNSSDESGEWLTALLNDYPDMDTFRTYYNLPDFLDDSRAYGYLTSYLQSDNFNLDRLSLYNNKLNLSRETAFLSEVYGSDYNMMSEFYSSIGSMIRDLEKVTARYNLEQATYDLNTASDTIHADVDPDGNLIYSTPENNVALDPEQAVNAVNMGNQRSYFQNKFEGEVKEVMAKYSDNWSKKAESGEWWSFFYDFMIMALPYFISGLGSGTISLFRGGNTINNTSYSNTTNTGPTDIVSNRYFNGMP